jgi:hypothetical protein
MTENFHALAISDEELMSVAYEEDNLSAEERAHLAQCSICQQRLATFRRTTGTLRTKLFLRLCPSAIDLNYYCLGGLPVEERTHIAAHLLDCPLCAAEVAEMRRQQASFEPFPETEPLPALSLRRLFATRVFQQVQLTTRDDLAPADWPRQYHADAVDLSLHLSRSPEGDMMLLGIITSANPIMQINALEGGTVELYLAPGPRATTESEQEEIQQSLLSTQIDDVGGILLEPVPAGNYVMIIRLPGQEIVIEGLDISYE